MRLHPTWSFAVVWLGGLSACASAQIPRDYYDEVDTRTAATLRASLHRVIDDHVRFPYTASSTDTWDILELADQDPADPNRIVDLYKNASYPKQGRGNRFYDREHAWPSSYGFPEDDRDNYPFTDCFMLFLCDSSYNEARSNKPFGRSRKARSEYPTVRRGATDGPQNHSNWTGGSFTKGRWEVWQARRGDVARALFYADVRYEGGFHQRTSAREPDLILTDREDLIARGKTGSNEPVAYMGMRDTLLRWHRQDPVSDAERRRNEVIHSFQGNRNPFIDHPEWVALLFGEPREEPASRAVARASGAANGPWINELHYDNKGTDSGEFVEIGGPSGTDLRGWQLVGYNGKGGAPYQTVSLAGLIPDQANRVGTVSFPFEGLQNGGPDGLALVDPNGVTVEFLSYEGRFTATDGPATGLTSHDIGVAESSATPPGASLQKAGVGNRSADFTWAVEAEATPDRPNQRQRFETRKATRGGHESAPPNR